MPQRLLLWDCSVHTGNPQAPGLRSLRLNNPLPSNVVMAHRWAATDCAVTRRCRPVPGNTPAGRAESPLFRRRDVPAVTVNAAYRHRQSQISAACLLPFAGNVQIPLRISLLTLPRIQYRSAAVCTSPADVKPAYDVYRLGRFNRTVTCFATDSSFANPGVQRAIFYRHFHAVSCVYVDIQRIFTRRVEIMTNRGQHAGDIYGQ